MKLPRIKITQGAALIVIAGVLMFWAAQRGDVTGTIVGAALFLAAVQIAIAMEKN